MFSVISFELNEGLSSFLTSIFSPEDIFFTKSLILSSINDTNIEHNSSSIKNILFSSPNFSFSKGLSKLLTKGTTNSVLIILAMFSVDVEIA